MFVFQNKFFKIYFNSNTLCVQQDVKYNKIMLYIVNSNIQQENVT